MPSRSSRRKSSRVRDARSSSRGERRASSSNGSPKPNGNGATHVASLDDEPRENIFLFWPNIIGKLPNTAWHPLTCAGYHDV